MTPAGDGIQVPPPQASAWNIANALTISRLAMVPVFGWLLLHDGDPSTNYRLLAAGVFLVATATDRIDGDAPTAVGTGGFLVDQKLDLHVDPAFLGRQPLDMRDVAQIGSIRLHLGMPPNIR